MPGSEPRPADVHRWRRDIVRRLEDFPRQYAALENSMGTFGEDFDIGPFKDAFDTTDDMDAYNRVQAVERAVGRVQNFIAELSEGGVKLALLPPGAGKASGSAAQRAFESLRDAGVIDGGICSRLVQAQNARSRIEHAYVHVPAGDVHHRSVPSVDRGLPIGGPS
jgi:hypothetical protein